MEHIYSQEPKNNENTETELQAPHSSEINHFKQEEGSAFLSDGLCVIPMGIERTCGFTSAVFLARELLLPSLCKCAESSERAAKKIIKK